MPPPSSSSYQVTPTGIKTITWANHFIAYFPPGTAMNHRAHIPPKFLKLNREQPILYHLIDFYPTHDSPFIGQEANEHFWSHYFHHEDKTLDLITFGHFKCPEKHWEIHNKFPCGSSEEESCRDYS